MPIHFYLPVHTEGNSISKIGMISRRPATMPKHSTSLLGAEKTLNVLDGPANSMPVPVLLTQAMAADKLVPNVWPSMAPATASTRMMTM